MPITKAKTIFQKLQSAYKIPSEDGLVELNRSARAYLRGRFARKLHFECDGVGVAFDTTTQIAKDWFFPGHIGGELHEPALTRAIIETLDSDAVFYDIGANIGYFTLFASEICTEGAVHAFELDPKFVEAIRRSLGRNGTSATLVHAAISDTDNDQVAYTGGTVPSIDNSGEQSDSVETLSLDRYVQDHPSPDVMKVDVEGFELAVLRGAQRLFNQSNDVTIFLEVHPRLLRQYGASAEDVLSQLDEFGFSYSAFDHRSAEPTVKENVDVDDIAANAVLECSL